MTPKYLPILYREALIAAREGRGLTQKQAAEQFHVAFSTWQKYEHGRRAPAHKNRWVKEAAATFFGVPADVLWAKRCA